VENFFKKKWDKVGICGFFFLILSCNKFYAFLFLYLSTRTMPKLLGEFECTMDNKGRLKLPIALVRKLGGGEEGKPLDFVLNRGFEKCLMLYPKTTWDSITEEIEQLNQYNKKNRDFVRYFYRGATEVTTDSADRILLTKRQCEYAALEKDLILFAYIDKIEIWDKNTYDTFLEEEPEDFSDLAEEVMGRKEV
jgi:MraZ protein